MINTYVERLNSLLENEEVKTSLSKAKKLQEVKKLRLALIYFNKKNIENETVEVCLENLLTAIESLDVIAIDSYLTVTQGEVLRTINGAVSDIHASELPKKQQAKQVKDLTSVASHIIPDYLNNIYVFIDRNNLDKKIFNENGEQVFDFERYFEAISKLAIYDASINNLPTYSADVTNKYRKVIESNAEQLLNLTPYMQSVVFQNPRDAVFVEDDTNYTYDLEIRKLRYLHRPANKNHELLPSYLDFVSVDGGIIPYEQHKLTPSYNLAPSETEEDYLQFVNSNDFKNYVSRLETPIGEIGEMGADKYFEVKSERNNGKYSLCTEELSDYDDNYVSLGYYPKESISLMGKDYKLAKHADSPTTIINKQKNEKLITRAKRIGAGTMAVIIIALALSVPVRYLVESSQDETQITEPQPENGDESFKNNVEVVEPENIPENPAEEYEPEVDNVGDNGTIKPIVPPTENQGEEVTTPETPELPEGETPEVPEGEVTTPETPEEYPVLPPVVEEGESDPSYDQPDSEVPEKNDDINNKREEESSDDEFFFD